MAHHDARHRRFNERGMTVAGCVECARFAASDTPVKAAGCGCLPVVLLAILVALLA